MSKMFMKIGKIVTFSIVLVLAYSAFIFINYVTSFESYGGCSPRDDVQAVTTMEPDVPCLSAQAGSFCLPDIQLDIRSSCDEAFLYDRNGTTLEVYKHEDWLNIYENNANAVTTVYDHSVPQDFGSWTRELRYKDNPEDKILISVTVTEREPVTAGPNFLPIDAVTIAKSIVVLVVAIIFYFLFIFKSKKKSKT